MRKLSIFTHRLGLGNGRIFYGGIDQDDTASSFLSMSAAQIRMANFFDLCNVKNQYYRSLQMSYFITCKDRWDTYQ